MNTIPCIHTPSWHDPSVYVIRGSLQPEARYIRDIDVDVNVGEIQKVKFLWNNKVINLFRPTMGASQITVQRGKDGKEYVSDIPSMSGCIYGPLCLCILPIPHPPIQPSSVLFIYRTRVFATCRSFCLPLFSILFLPFDPLTPEQREKKDRKGAVLSLDSFLLIRGIEFLGGTFDLCCQNI